MTVPVPTSMTASTSAFRARTTRWRGLLLGAAVATTSLTGLAAVPASAAVGEEVIAWQEVEDGAITGGAAGPPAYNSGDHGNFSGRGSYTFRETGMTSTMTVVAPQAGTYPVWIRYAAGPLSAEENITRAMGLTTNGERQIVSYPLTGSWEDWEFARADVTLNQGTNTIAINCDRGQEICRLNFDAIQVGGTAPDPCAATPVRPGATALFDGTFASFDGWRKAGGGGFGRQEDCTIRGFRGPGATWFGTQQGGTYTLDVDWRRTDADDASSVFVGSSTNGSGAPTGGFAVRIGPADTGAIVPTGEAPLPADAAALAGAVKPLGQWNTFTIQVTPQRLRVLLNGVAVNAVDRTVPATGYVGLENRGDAAQVDFRDIQVRPEVELATLVAPVRRAVTADGTTTRLGAESTLGNLVAEAQRWATRSPANGNAKLALVSPASLEADLTGGTYDDAAGVVADEQLVNLRLTGADLRTVLEQQWRGTSFVRLGASDGFTWTEDPTRPAGSRVTGLWLDGVTIVPTNTYSVTAPQSLADGGDGFDGFTRGIGRRTPPVTAVSALAALLGDRSAGGPVAPGKAQHAVGVVPSGGAPASYVAGTPLAIELGSWSYSRPGDPVDGEVAVTVAGRSLGTVAVDNTAVDEEYDGHGRVAVRTVLPADLPAGATTVELTGTTTGTKVRVPVVVTAAPPAPTPTPDPTPVPAPAPMVVKVAPRIGLTLKPTRVTVGVKARLVVRVTAPDDSPTGKVRVKVGERTLKGTLRRGKVTLTLPPFARAGKAKVKVAYAGDAHTLAASKVLRIRVRAAR